MCAFACFSKFFLCVTGRRRGLYVRTYGRMDEWTNEWWRLSCCARVSSCRVAFPQSMNGVVAALMFGREHASSTFRPGAYNEWECVNLPFLWTDVCPSSRHPPMEELCCASEMSRRKKKVDSFVDPGSTYHRWPNAKIELDQPQPPWDLEGADADAIMLVDHQHWEKSKRGNLN